MLTFFGQPKFSGATADDEHPIGYELFIREYQEHRWVLPDDFDDISATEIENLLTETLSQLPETIQLISFNLEQAQFIRPEYAEMVARVQATTPIKIYTELTERPNPQITSNQLLAGAKRFSALGLLVCIDDVGTGVNTLGLALKLDGYVSEYKFAFQNLRPFNAIDDIADQLDFWYQFAQEQHKTIAIEGVESKVELERVRRDYPCEIIQGYYLGKPTQLLVEPQTSVIDDYEQLH